MGEKVVCPNCNTAGVSWVGRTLAAWPFSVHCANCGAKLRLHYSWWQNALIQLCALVTFGTAVLLGISLGMLGVGFVLGIIAAIIAAVVGGLFAKIDVIERKSVDGNSPT